MPDGGPRRLRGRAGCRLRRAARVVADRRTYDYKVTIPIDGDATIRMKAFDIDCLHRYCQNNALNPCKGYVLAASPPPKPRSMARFCA